MPLDPPVRNAIGPSPFLEGLDPAGRAAVLSRAARQAHGAGSVLFRQDDSGARLYLVASGRLKVWRVTPSGTPVTIRYLGPGELAGCVAVFCGGRYPATATAVTDVQVLCWSSSAVASMLAEHPQLKSNALTIVGDRNSEMLQRIEQLSTESAERRVARALLRMADGSRPGPAVACLSRQDLGELTGTTLHTVSRIVSRWERQGWLRGGRQRIVIDDPEALRNLFASEENSPLFAPAQRASG
jgi:CRP-like cAMP-binding protein